jgi:hypothetical protein
MRQGSGECLGSEPFIGASPNCVRLGQYKER